jgi:hypothetical protein
MKPNRKSKLQSSPDCQEIISGESTVLKPSTKILQVVPATEWDAICIYENCPPLRIPITGWALTTEPGPISIVSGVMTNGQLWDEQLEFLTYAHTSTGTETVLARLGEGPYSPRQLPLRLIHCSLRELRVLGLVRTGEYPKFQGTDYRGDLSNVPSADIEWPEPRRTVAIAPAKDARAIYATADGPTHEPIAVWALLEEPDGSFSVGGIDRAGFLGDEWTNFVGYEPQPPKSDDLAVFVGNAVGSEGNGN